MDPEYADIDRGIPSSMAKVSATEKLRTDVIEIIAEAKQRLRAFRVSERELFCGDLMKARTPRGAAVVDAKRGIERALELHISPSFQ